MQVVNQRLVKLETKGSPGRTMAEILIKRRKRGRNSPETWEAVRARGHLDEVLELRAQQPPSKPKLGEAQTGDGDGVGITLAGFEWVPHLLLVGMVASWRMLVH